MKSSTATGTTATAETSAAAAGYRGRFAPSPTGLLHHGSLLTALASWLDARAHDGAWLVRMEDLDAPRNVAGAAARILHTLDAFGLHPDDPVLWQSTRGAAYQSALRTLAAAGRAYRCTCSRSDEPGIYSGHCRRNPPADGPAAWRFAMEPGDRLEFVDRLQGARRFQINAIGDPVIFRRDGVAAYQLAVVVDDAHQGVTHVVRGLDLLDSTVWQMAIGRALGYPEPQYAHLPLVVEPDGSKLAKSRRASAVAELPPRQALLTALEMLGFRIPARMAAEPLPCILEWAIEAWAPAQLRGRTVIPVQ